MFRFLVFLAVKTITVIFFWRRQQAWEFHSLSSLPLSGQITSIVSELFNLKSMIYCIASKAYLLRIKKQVYYLSLC